MTGKKNWKEVENEQKLGKRRYLERRAEEREADEEVEEFLQGHDLDYIISNEDKRTTS